MDIQKYKSTLQKGLLLTSIDENGITTEEFYLQKDSFNSETNNLLKFEEKDFLSEKDFTDEEKIYFLPECTVPRFKVKMYTENNKSAMVRDINKATCLIATEESIIHQVVEGNYVYHYDNSDIIKILNCLYGEYSPKTIRVISELNKGVKLYMDYNTKNRILYFDSPQKPFPKNLINEYSTLGITKVNLNTLDYYEKLINSKKIFHQNILLDKISSDIVMNEEMFEETKKMFQSTDYENTELALELMANCNYKKSAAFLLSLLTTYRNNIRNSKSKNHVNVKSMFEFFDINLNNYIDIEDILTILEEKQCMTEEQLLFLIPGMKDEAIRNMGILSNYLDIELKLKPEVLKKAKVYEEEKSIENAEVKEEDSWNEL
jgi:hypothetical protein